ncbi:MAG: putative toxin-antitoxin system toxin component, PIN family [Caldilineaceae bacterium]
MRVILDTNIFISYLLAKREGGTIRRIVEGCLLRPEVLLIVPNELKEEILSVWARKPALQKAIPLQRLESVLLQIQTIAEVPAPIEEILQYNRDPKDDYLIAYGLFLQADYLVSGDEDLTVLKQIKILQIISPVEFLMVLEPESSV